MVITISSIFGADFYAQKSELSLDLKSTTVENVLLEIEKATGYYFLYNSKLIDVNRIIENVNFKNEKLTTILNNLFPDGETEYFIKGNQIILSSKTFDKFYNSGGFLQQNKKIEGKVFDENGIPLIGVNILEKGTLNGTITDENGKYSINITTNEPVLIFSFVGYNTEEVTVADKSVINVNLKPTTEKLEEVVVIGYGVQRKEAVTGSVASISGEKIKDIPSANISQALQGRLPGVELARTSTKPGSTMQIRIRGTRSLTASNDPLIVLDGIPFPGSLSDISPSDIKSIDILKDASSTAIYGSRGANGVILITTFKGQKGEKARITYESYIGMNKIFAKYPKMDGPEFVKLRQAAGRYANGVDESDDVNTDWQDLLYRKGMVTNQNFGLSGGTEKSNYSFGLGYYRDEAVLPGQDYNRISWRATFDQEVGKLFRFGFTSSNNYSISNGNNLGLYSTLSATPIANPYNADGSLKRTVRMSLDENWVYTKEIIENLGDKWIDQSKTLGSYNSINGEVKIPGINGLKYKINASLNFRNNNSGSYTGQGVFSANPTTESTGSISYSNTLNWAIENLLTYDRTFADKHQINIVGLYSAEQNKYTRTYVSAKNIPADQFQFYNLGQALGEKTVDPGQQYYELSGLISYMGRIMYSYDNRYMLSVAVRSDGSSRLAEGHKWHTYPAISAGWNLANESFLKDINEINLLKIRLGYGQTANQSINPYSTLGRLSTRPYNFGDDFVTGYYVSELPNYDLGWEYSITYNYGLDFTVLNKRLSGTFEYYITNTKDILLNVNLPITAGVSNYMANIGETQNKGWELSLQGTILNNFNGITWDAGLNFYSNRNKIVALSSGQQRDEANWWFVGYPIDVIYDYEKIGLWQEGDQYRDILEPGGNVGMIKVKYTGDYNTDGTPVRAIGPDDRQIMSMEPDFQGGFNTRISFKGFDLTTIGVFKKGGILISTLYSSAGYLNLLTGRRNNIKVDYWTPENPNAKYPNPSGILSGDNPKYGSTLGYFDASFLKIRTITLGYNFEQKWISKVGIEKLRLYFTMQNPFVMFSPYNKESGMDPETNSYGNENAAVPMSYNLRRLLTIGTNTPSTKNYLVGINLTF